MKKIVMLILTLAATVVLFSMPFSATTDTVDFTENTVNAKTGGYATVTASVSEELIDGAVSISYDKTALKLTNAQWNVPNAVNSGFDMSKNKGVFYCDNIDTSVSVTFTFQVLTADHEKSKKVEVAMFGHDENGDEVAITKNSCTVNIGHDSTKLVRYAVNNADNTKHNMLCSCGKILNTDNHTLDEGQITTEATCGSKAIKTYTCTVCKNTEAHEFGDYNPNVHKWDGGRITRPSTRTKEGIKTLHCVYCTATTEVNYAVLAENSGKITAGDTVDILDVLTLKKVIAALGDNTPSPEQIAKYDVNGDGLINNNDVLSIMFCILYD